MVLASLILWWSQRPPRERPLLREWRLFKAQLVRYGLTVEAAESPPSLLRRVARQWPSLATQAQATAELAEACLYRPDGGDEDALARSLRALRRMLRPGTETAAARDVHKGTV